MPMFVTKTSYNTRIKPSILQNKELMIFSFTLKMKPDLMKGRDGYLNTKEPIRFSSRGVKEQQTEDLPFTIGGARVVAGICKFHHNTFCHIWRRW